MPVLLMVNTKQNPENRFVFTISFEVFHCISREVIQRANNFYLVPYLFAMNMVETKLETPREYDQRQDKEPVERTPTRWINSPRV